MQNDQLVQNSFHKHTHEQLQYLYEIKELIKIYYFLNNILSLSFYWLASTFKYFIMERSGDLISPKRNYKIFFAK